MSRLPWPGSLALILVLMSPAVGADAAPDAKTLAATLKRGNDLAAAYRWAEAVPEFEKASLWPRGCTAATIRAPPQSCKPMPTSMLPCGSTIAPNPDAGNAENSRIPAGEGPPRRRRDACQPCQPPLRAKQAGAWPAAGSAQLDIRVARLRRQRRGGRQSADPCQSPCQRRPARQGDAPVRAAR